MVFSDLFFLFVFIPAFAILYLLAGWVDKKLLFRPDKPRKPTHGEATGPASRPETSRW